MTPQFWLAGFNAFCSSVPNGGLTTFGSIIVHDLGFSASHIVVKTLIALTAASANLETILLSIPRSVTSVLIFVVVGIVTSKYKNLRLYIMGAATIPPLIGFLGMALIPTRDGTKWSKWGMYFMTVPFVLSLFLAWTLIISNLPGRTKRTLTSSWTFMMYCVGNMVGSQIFKSEDAPTYIPGVVGCVVCFGLEIIIIATWRTILVLRNRRRDRAQAKDGLTDEERIRQGKINGEKDLTDFENPYFRYTL